MIENPFSSPDLFAGQKDTKKSGATVPLSLVLFEIWEYTFKLRKRMSCPWPMALTLLGQLHDVVESLYVHPHGQGDIVLPHGGQQGREVDDPVDPVAGN